MLAHSPSAVVRAKQLFGRRPDAEIAGPCDGPTGVLRAAGLAGRSRRKVVYLVDVGASTTVAALVARLRRRAVILDTGDLVFELERSRGERNAVALAIVWLGERLAVACADRIVVRGHRHGDFLRRPVFVAPDLAPEGSRPVSSASVRHALGLESAFVVGLVGSLQRAPSLGITYGWDLVEALAYLPDHIQGLIVGDGAGRTELEARAQALRVAERLHIVGQLAGDVLLAHIAAMDVALSTQTNDAVGAVRTTGKLPLYLACGCPVLASDVGEARRLLGPLGWTVRYDGVVDEYYPRRLARRVQDWSEDRSTPQRRVAARDIFERHFGPERIAAAVNSMIDCILGEVP